MFADKSSTVSEENRTIIKSAKRPVLTVDARGLIKLFFAANKILWFKNCFTAAENATVVGAKLKCIARKLVRQQNVVFASQTEELWGVSAT